MYLVGAAGNLDIVLSDSGRLVHGPLDVRCKAKNWNTLPETFPSFALGPVPQLWSVLNTVGQQSLHLFTYCDGSPGPLSSSLFCSLVNQGLPDPPTKGERVD
jgi:hypothetical protein